MCCCRESTSPRTFHLAFFRSQRPHVDCHIKRQKCPNKIASTKRAIGDCPLILMVTSPLGPVLRPAGALPGSERTKNASCALLFPKWSECGRMNNFLGVLAWLMAAEFPRRAVSVNQPATDQHRASNTRRQNSRCRNIAGGNDFRCVLVLGPKIPLWPARVASNSGLSYHSQRGLGNDGGNVGIQAGGHQRCSPPGWCPSSKHFPVPIRPVGQILCRPAATEIHLQKVTGVAVIVANGPIIFQRRLELLLIIIRRLINGDVVGTDVQRRSSLWQPGR